MDCLPTATYNPTSNLPCTHEAITQWLHSFHYNNGTCFSTTAIIRCLGLGNLEDHPPRPAGLGC